MRWCLAHGLVDSNPAASLSDRTSPLRSYRRTYGKVQDKNPGRWLTKEQAYEQLLSACKDGTILGLRDEILLRLGLAGLRRAEIARLSVRDVSRLPLITWTGKGHKPRKTTAGPSLIDAIARYLDAYDDPK